MTDAMYGRDLGLAGVPNARDLGGYRTIAGGQVRSGVLFRSDAPISATDEDLVMLASLGVRTVIDLRGDSEVARFGLSTWTAPRVHLPVSDISGAIIAALIVDDDAERMTAEESERMMIGMYRSFVIDEVWRSQFAEALGLIAAPGGLPLLFHCAAGKDRTGWLAALVLTALGADRETVLADYLLTNERFGTGRGAEARDLVLSVISGMVPDLGPVMPMLDARPAYLEAGFDAVAEAFGTFAAFLDEMDVDAEALRANLLE